jgi:hypothetical protein
MIHYSLIATLSDKDYLGAKVLLHWLLDLRWIETMRLSIARKE